MNGSLPPSSTTDFLRCLPAVAATDRPAPSLPVSVTAAMRGSAMIPSTRSVPMSSVWNTPSGNPARREDFLDCESALRDVRCVLEQSDVAGHQRRRGETEHLPERKIPRHDRQHDAQRLESDPRLPVFDFHRLVGEEPPGVLRVVPARRSRISRLRRPRRRWACPSRGSSAGRASASLPRGSPPLAPCTGHDRGKTCGGDCVLPPPPCSDIHPRVAARTARTS